MDNAEEIFHFLEEFAKRKPKTIPQELNDYLAYVARTGDPVYQWSLVKCLFKEKLMTVITDFYETTPGIEIPPYPNVDPFNYDIMKNSLLERLDSFTSAPFTVQRICELLTYPRKQYNRIDKFMRAIEKNILVVSTREPGVQRHPEPDNGEPMEPVVNGTDNNSEYNVDVEMEDMSWKENTESQNHSEPQPSSSDTQPSSSDTHISVDDLASRLHTKQDVPEEAQHSLPSEASPSLNEVSDSSDSSSKPNESEVSNDIVQKTEIIDELSNPSSSEPSNTEVSSPTTSIESNTDTEMKAQTINQDVVIPEIKIDDAEMTEQKLSKESIKLDKEPKSNNEELKTDQPETITQTVSHVSSDESSSDSNCKEETEPKIIAEVITSSEENSSSSDNTEGNSNSPKAEESNCEEPIKISTDDSENASDANHELENDNPLPKSPEKHIVPQMQTDNYSISDVNSELSHVTPEKETVKTPESEVVTPKETTEDRISEEETKPESAANEVESPES